jgi:hypothetical protein
VGGGEGELTVVRIIQALGAVANRKGGEKEKSGDAVWREAEEAAHAIGMLPISNMFVCVCVCVCVCV